MTPWHPIASLKGLSTRHWQKAQNNPGEVWGTLSSGHHSLSWHCASGYPRGRDAQEHSCSTAEREGSPKPHYPYRWRGHKIKCSELKRLLNSYSLQANLTSDKSFGFKFASIPPSASALLSKNQTSLLVLIFPSL